MPYDSFEEASQRKLCAEAGPIECAVACGHEHDVMWQTRIAAVVADDGLLYLLFMNKSTAYRINWNIARCQVYRHGTPPVPFQSRLRVRLGPEGWLYLAFRAEHLDWWAHSAPLLRDIHKYDSEVRISVAHILDNDDNNQHYSRSALLCTNATNIRRPVTLRNISTYLDPETHHRFLKALRLWKTLSHTGASKVYGLCHYNGYASLVMEPESTEPAQTLDDYLFPPVAGPYSAIPSPVQLGLIKSLILAVHYVHSYKLVHGDLNPCRILITDPTILQVKLTDFGNYQQAHPAYTAPEAFVDLDNPDRPYPDPDPTMPGDIYSMSMVMWAILTHSRPWQGMPAQKIQQTVTMAPHNYHSGWRVDARPPITDIPSSPSLIMLSQCWAHDPTKRTTAYKLADFITLVPTE